MKNIILITMFLTFLFSACTQRYPLDLGGGYKIDCDGNSYSYIKNKNNIGMINAHITYFKFDSTFIVVEQKPVDLIMEDAYLNPEMNLRKFDKLFEESTLRLYWIINKKEKSEYSFDTLTQLARYSNVYGPFSEKEYLKKRKELGVPDKLDLKKTNEKGQ